jgi:DNA end-binding protein Ku
LYRDAYREALEALVQAKIEGNDVVRPSGPSGEADKGTGPLDLAETLRASVEAAKASRAKDGTRSDAGKPDTGKAAAKPAGTRKPAARKSAEPKAAEPKAGSRRKASA